MWTLTLTQVTMNPSQTMTLPPAQWDVTDHDSNHLPSEVGPQPKLPGNSYWAFGPKVGLRPTKDCIEEGEGKAPPSKKLFSTPSLGK